MRDVTRGGLGTVLNEIADSSGVSMEIRENSIPVDSEVKGFCGIMGLDPIYMGNEGKMLTIVNGAQAERALELIRTTEVGKDACIIGYVKDGAGVFSKTKIGGTRKIDLLYGEGLPRIC
jgi:hydrogenase expression/formation protein HypE